MGTFIGHILPGTGFLLLGLWHLYNTLWRYVRYPCQYKTRTWFTLSHGNSRLRHVELYFIIVGSCISIAGELLPDRFWSVSTHLNNFEHSTISFSLIIYAAFALAYDVLEIHVPQGWLHATAALALCQELLLFHFHSADHMGLEGHYHWLLQLPIAVGILALLVEIVVLHLPVVAIGRSMSLVLQGIWFILMGFILWTPSLIPKGCHLVHNDHVECLHHSSLTAAKGLANLQFSWLITGIMLCTASVYIAAAALRKYQGGTSYQHLNLEGDHMTGSGRALKVVDDLEHGRLSNSLPDGGSQDSTELQGLNNGLEYGR